MKLSTLANAVQNARHTSQVITCTTAAGTAQDLTGATLYGKLMGNGGAVTTITGTLVITGNAALGVFTWNYSAADVATPGAYSVQFMAVYGDGTREKSSKTTWHVLESLDFASQSPSASLSPSASASAST